MDTTLMNPPEVNLETARVPLRTFVQVFDYKHQLALLRDFMAGLPGVAANQTPIEEVDQLCVICQEPLWSSTESDPLRLACCGKLIHRSCLTLWLSSEYDGGGNAHTCPFCRQGLIPKWPEKNEVPDQDEDDDPSGDHVRLNFPLRWVPKWVLILGWDVSDDSQFVDIIYQTLGDIEHPRVLAPGYAIQARSTNVHIEQELLLDLGFWEETT